MEKLSRLRNHLKIQGDICFESAFHLGTGEEGAGGIDMGVLLDLAGNPLIPGSSLKGAFRSHAEALAEHLGLTTCSMDLSGWESNNRRCVGKSKKKEQTALQALERMETEDHASAQQVTDFLHENLCDTCLLFGSVLAASRVFFRDAEVKWWPQTLERRDGVGIDRDSGRAVDQVKFDYEVVSADSIFSFQMEADNLNDDEKALIFAVLAEWMRGFHLGGMTSRGLGAAKLQQVDVRQVDYSDREHIFNYLVNGEMSPIDESERTEIIRRVFDKAATRGQ